MSTQENTNRDFFNSVIDRLRVALALKNDAEIAEAIGLKANAFANRKKSGSIPYEEIVNIALSRGLNLDEIFSAGNSPGVTREPAQKYLVIKNDPVATSSVPDGFILVPHYEVHASAGGGALVCSEQIVDYLAFKADWVRNTLGVSQKDLALISVKGDSMEPALSNDDLILVDMRRNRVEDNAIYVLQLNSTLLVKRIQHKLDGSLHVMSDNPRYEAEVVSAESAGDLMVLGRVVWSGRRM